MYFCESIMRNLDNNIWSSLMALVRLGMGHSTPEETARQLPESIPWKEVEEAAVQHRLSAIVMDGILALEQEDLLNGREPDMELRDRFLVRTLQHYELKYEDYTKALAGLARFYDKNGFRMMILKGYGLSLNYPVPSHRPTGDFDIWTFGRHAEADEALERLKHVKIDRTHHHHTVFYTHGFMVEHHYDFIEVYSHRSSARFEKILKEWAPLDPEQIEVSGIPVWLPNPDFNALFLLRHAASHFASVEILLRHVLDWGTFVARYHDSIHWDRVLPVLEQFSMTQFMACLDAICIEDLGFDASHFPALPVDRELKRRVLQDIEVPEFNEQSPDGFLPIIRFKFRRWKANEWKQSLIFRENRFGMLLTQTWSHLIKPSSIASK